MPKKIYPNSLFALAALLLSFYPLSSLSQSVIKKCQDSEGKWHYGQHASINCVSSVDSIRQDGVAVTEPVINEPKAEDNLDGPSEIELKQQANDEAILLRYSSVEAIKTEESRKLSEIDSQLTMLKAFISKLGSDIEFYAEKEQTDTVIEQIAQRQAALLKYLTQEQSYIDKRDLIATQYASRKNNFKEASVRLEDAQ